jgi:integrase
MSAMNPTGKHRPKRHRHGEGSVFQRKDVYPAGHRLAGQRRYRENPWVAVVPYVDGSGRRRETWLSASSRQAADDLRRREVAKRARGLVPTDQTVGDYVSAWLETVEVGPGTWPRYRSHLTERIEPAFGNVPLDRLTPQMVRSGMLGWQGAAATRGGALRLLRAAMRQAVADRRIEHDPTAGIPYPKATRREPVTLTGAQARRLMAVVKGERFAPILVVSLGLGVRRGEALGLRTQDMDIDQGFVTIAKSLRYIAPALRDNAEGPYRLTGTKTGETRVVPLPGFVKEALVERLNIRDAEQRAAKVYAPNGFVFCDPLGNSVPLETLYRWFKVALDRAGLPDMRWHDLRASTITVLLDMGVDLLTIQRIVGHKDLATTQRYVGKTPAAMNKAAAGLDEAMG